jgi:hypothetical protein
MMNGTLRAGVRQIPLAIFLACVAAVGVFGVLTFLIVIVIFPNRGPMVFPMLSPLACPTGGDLTLDTTWGRRYYDHFTLGYTCTAGASELPADELRMFVALVLICFAVIAIHWLLDARRDQKLHP